VPGSFQSVSQKEFWKRVSVPSVVALSASLFLARSSIAGVFAEWAHIPAVCSPDFPISGSYQVQCDLFWKMALIHAAFAAIPVVLVIAGIVAVYRAQTAFYRKAHLRIRGSKADFSTGVCQGEPAREDLFSLVYCLKPIQVDHRGERFTVYLCPNGEPSQSVGYEFWVYELGVFFSRPRRLAVSRIKRELDAQQNDNAGRDSIEPKAA
jgi:hypothetical protein